MIISRHCLLLGAILLSACSTVPTGEKFAEREPIIEGLATVYLFRTPAFEASSRDYNIFVNDSIHAVLPNGSYSVSYLEPGRYTFGAQIVEKWYGKGDRIDIEYEVQANQEYFIGYIKTWDLDSRPEDFFLAATEDNSYNATVGYLLQWDDAMAVVNPDYAFEELKKLKRSLYVQTDATSENKYLEIAQDEARP